MRRYWIVVLALALLLAASGCGSSGGPGATAGPENRWDVMNWDAGQWGP